MPRSEMRPSRPEAVLVTIFGLALLTFGAVQVTRQDGFHWFLVVWVLVGLALIGFFLTRAFGRRPGTAVNTADRDSPGGLARNKPLAVISAVRDSPGGLARNKPLAVNAADRESPGRLVGNKPLAVISTVAGAGAIAYVSIRTADGKPLGSWLLFAAVGLAAIGFNLWITFGRRI